MLDTLSTRLKYARKKKKLTQQQLAEKVGIKQQAVQRIETNRVHSTSYIVQLAQALNVTPEWLALGETDDEPSSSVLAVHESGTIYRAGINFVPLLPLSDISVYLHDNNYVPTVDIQLIPITTPPKGKSFAVLVDDDSMISNDAHELSFYRNDVLIIDNGLKPCNNAFVLVNFTADIKPAIKLRQYITDNKGDYVRPFNTKHRSTIYSPINCQILGRVTQRISYV